MESAWILCLDPRESLTERLAASLFEWKAESLRGQPSAAGAFSVFLREETAEGWVEVPTAQTRLVPQDWNSWKGRFPANANAALLLKGELLICFPVRTATQPSHSLVIAVTFHSRPRAYTAWLWRGKAQEAKMRVMKFIILAVDSGGGFDFAACAAPAKTAPTVKHVPITNAPSNSGKEMFNSYCAVCHGNDGKGDGPTRRCTLRFG